MNIDEISKKPNMTKPIQNPNPIWNDYIFAETLEENTQKDGNKRQIKISSCQIYVHY